MAKGYYGARSKVYTVAKNAVERSLIYSYIGRKQKKEILDLYGYKELMLDVECIIYLILNL